MSRGKTISLILGLFLLYCFADRYGHKLGAYVPTVAKASALDKGKATEQSGYYSVLTAEPTGEGKWSVTYFDEGHVLRTAKFQDYCAPIEGRIIFVEWIEYEHWPQGRSNYARCGNR